MTKTEIINALRVFISQRPGLEYGNYGDPVSYRAEVRSIGKDLTIARTLLLAVELRDSITAEMILDASKSGRLSITEESGKVIIDYCTGQYWCTEYRPAVSRLLSSVLWAWWRDQCMPKPFKVYGTDNDWYAYKIGNSLPVPVSAGTYLRKTAQREFGRGIASRFFN
jgi:hypothetical protein